MCNSNYYQEGEARSLGDEGYQDLGGRSGGERSHFFIFYFKVTINYEIPQHR